jgi:hypothetical protein
MLTRKPEQDFDEFFGALVFLLEDQEGVINEKKH